MCMLKRYPDDHLKDKIISWFLHYSANKKHGSWSRTLGRISWAGTFKTTLTTPEPTGTQGKVLHPDQNRICFTQGLTRSQLFQDRFTLNRDIRDKHKQIENAVAPPMGKAIGDELVKAFKSRTSGSASPKSLLGLRDSEIRSL